MKPAIETLESRQLLHGGPGGAFGGGLLAKAEGVTDPAVQADVVLIKADQSAIDAARTKIAGESSGTRDTLEQTLQDGFDLLQADRKAIRDAAGDDTAVQAAKDKLKADRNQLFADIKDARDAIRNETTDGRAALQTALSSLRDHLKQLRTDLQNAGVVSPTPTPTTGGGDGTGTGGDNGNSGTPGTSTGEPHHGGWDGNLTVTPEQAQAAADKIKAAAANISGIDQNAVNTLTDALVAGASDSTITSQERQQLRDDVKAVLQSANFQDLKDIAGALHDVLGVAGPQHHPLPFHG